MPTNRENSSGDDKAHKPYEFGVKVSVATTLNRSRGGQFVAHVKALPGNPYDGHTLATIIPGIESSIGVSLGKVVADAGYRGHNAPKDKMFKVHVAGYRRGLTKAIKRALRRRSAIEPVIGHLKNEHRMGRNFLKGHQGDRTNDLREAQSALFGTLDAYTLTDLSAGWRKDRWSVDVFLKNAFDTRAQLARFSECAALTCGYESYTVFAQPRTLGIRFSREF